MQDGLSEPKCKALLLCEKTILEAGTGKISLIGVFNGFKLDSSGRNHPVEIFLQVTDAQGMYRIKVEIHNLKDNRIIARADGPAIEIPDRLYVYNVILPFQPVTFKVSGLYDVVVFANEKEIDRQQFHVVHSNSSDSTND